MIERADSNNDKVVTQEDFYMIMTKKTFAWTRKPLEDLLNKINRFSAP